MRVILSFFLQIGHLFSGITQRMGHSTGQCGGGSQKISCLEIPTSHNGAVRPKTALKHGLCRD